MKERHMFAGVNSPKGFFSRFDQIMPDYPGKRKIYIKGGPGMGKSSLMKKIAAKARQEDLDCEVFHCSSDPSSLDAVHIPALSVAVLDATAPHNCDPQYTGMGGAFLDVSAFLRKDLMKYNADTIVKTVTAKKRAFSKGYQYLRAALPLVLQTENLYMSYLDIAAVSRFAEDLADRVMGKGAYVGSEERKLFLSAIGPEGFVNFCDTVCRDTYTVAVKGKCGTSQFIRRFAEIARLRGFSPVTFYCPMRPDEKIEHVYIPALRFSLTTYDFYTRAKAAEIVDIDDFISPMPEEDGETCGFASSLMQRAIDAFGEAKAAHASLEKIYVPAMDFSGMEEMSAKLLQAIF